MWLLCREICTGAVVTHSNELGVRPGAGAFVGPMHPCLGPRGSQLAVVRPPHLSTMLVLGLHTCDRPELCRTLNVSSSASVASDMSSLTVRLVSWVPPDSRSMA